jgi:DNA-binding transcriptional MocR family regulator
MLPALACRFTVGELAVLRIVGDEVRQHGCCACSVAELAARAGCGRTTAQNAIRQAASLGLVTVQERRREGRKNDTNVIRIVSKEWTLWLTRGGRSNSSKADLLIEFKKANPADSSYKNQRSRMAEPAWAAEEQQTGLAARPYGRKRC